MPSLRRRARQTFVTALALLLSLSALALPSVRAAGRPTGPAALAEAQAQAGDFVQRVVDLTNQERARHGLPALALDGALCRSALAHSRDMASHNYFSHTGSDGSTVGDRIRAAGYSPLWAYGENIAAGQPSPEEVVNAWMNSEGHRANILSPHYEHIGVGYVRQDGTTYLHYWTQHFASHGQLEPPPTPIPPTPVPPTPVPPTSVPPTPVPPTPVPPTPVPPTPIPPTPVPPTPTPVPTANSTPSPYTPGSSLIRSWQVMRLVNEERERAGLPALSLHPSLFLASQQHSMDMARRNFFSHTGSDGSSFAERVAEAGLGSPTALAENIGAGHLTAEQVVAAWMAHPGLRANILNPSLSFIGVGYAYSQGSIYRHYWTLGMAGRGAAPGTAVSPTSAGHPQRLGRHLFSLLHLFAASDVA